jgi:hypothetical protein
LGLGVFENKKFKESRFGLIHSVLADLKNRLVLGLKNLKRGGYVGEV